MEKRTFGQTGLEVSVLGFGAAEIGFQETSVDDAQNLLNSALDSGLNVIDTAECYGNSEELIGAAVSGRRDDFHLFTKCGHPDGMPSENWSRESILMSIERSLKRMRTDRVELVLLHSCSKDELEKGEAVAALLEAREKGYTRFVGYSGDSDAARYAVECGAFDALEISVSIADQEALDLVLPKAIERAMGVIAKRPIANACWRTGEKPESAYHHTFWERIQALKYPFINGELRESIDIALRFTLSVPGVHTAIVGTTKPGRWQDNAELVSKGPLPVEQFQDIRVRWSDVAGPDWVGQI